MGSWALHAYIGLACNLLKLWPYFVKYFQALHLSVTPKAFHSKLKSHLFNRSYPDPSDHSPLPISTTPTLTATLPPPGTLEIGPELLLTPLWKLPLIRRSARE